MADRYFNPFQAIDINVPVELHESFTRYCQTSGGADIDQSPNAVEPGAFDQRVHSGGTMAADIGDRFCGRSRHRVPSGISVPG
jgi:hypothetical protein